MTDLKVFTTYHVAYFHISKPNAFPSENPLSPWEGQLAWGPGFVKHKDTVIEQTLLKAPLPHSFTVLTWWPRKSSCKKLKERKMFLIPQQCSFFPNLTGLTAKSSCVFGSIKFEIVLQLWLHAADGYNDPSGDWEKVNPNSLGSNMNICPQESFAERHLAAGPGTEANCTWDQENRALVSGPPPSSLQGPSQLAGLFWASVSPFFVDNIPSVSKNSCTRA